MASFDRDPASGRYHIRFRHAGRPYKRSLALADDREAERACGIVEETIKDLKRGRLELPPGADVGSFLISGGRVAAKLVAADVSDPCQATLEGLFDTYEKELTPGAKEANTRETERTHRRNLLAHFGAGCALAALDHRAIQRYVNARSAAGMAVKTLRLELGTLRMLWNWGRANGHVEAPLPWEMKRLTFPKGDGRKPFQTWDQVERKLQSLERAGERTPERESRLWECLYLDEKQVQDCLAHVERAAAYPFIHPLFAFAAYTGARRSEVLRSEREDWDLDGGTVAIRQKKADTTRRFTLRRVPIHPALAVIMRAWFAAHPGGPFAICTANRARIGPRMGTKYFTAALRGSRWAVIPGYHCFRHSLASNLASRGVDQRLINDILGHSTEDMVRRYRHLLPQKKEESIHSLFR